MNEQQKLASSLSVFRALYDEKYNRSDILSQFIISIFIENKHFNITQTRMKQLLYSKYGFEIPESIIKSIFKKNKKISYNDDGYQYNESGSENDFICKIESYYNEASNSNIDIFNNICFYIEKKKAIQLTDIDKDEVLDSLYSFILKDKRNSKYTVYINSYIISNNNDTFIGNLNKIKEGLILYNGIMHSPDIDRLDIWRNETVLYFDTEILFYLAGYNGDLAKELFNDFHKLILDLNKKRIDKKKKALINLRYFSLVKMEIQSYFDNAEKIIKGEVKIKKGSPAMKEILKDCKKASDVVEKKVAFWKLLEKLSIVEERKDDFFNERNNIYNYNFNQYFDNNKKGNASSDMLHHLNVLRKGVNNKYIDQIKYILITNTTDVLQAANSFRKNKDICLAMHLDSITNILWFKLNKGFGKNTPKNIDMLTQAQIVINSLLNTTLSKDYDDILDKYHKGEIDKDYVTSLIVELNSKNSNADNITADNIDDTMLIITEQDLENKYREHDHINNKNEKLKEELMEYKEKENKRIKRKEKTRNFISHVVAILVTVVLPLLIIFILSKKIELSIFIGTIASFLTLICSFIALIKNRKAIVKFVNEKLFKKMQDK